MRRWGLSWVSPGLGGSSNSLSRWGPGPCPCSVSVACSQLVASPRACSRVPGPAGNARQSSSSIQHGVSCVPLWLLLGPGTCPRALSHALSLWELAALLSAPSSCRHQTLQPDLPAITSVSPHGALFLACHLPTHLALSLWVPQAHCRPLCPSPRAQATLRALGPASACLGTTSGLSMQHAALQRPVSSPSPQGFPALLSFTIPALLGSVCFPKGPSRPRRSKAAGSDSNRQCRAPYWLHFCPLSTSLMPGRAPNPPCMFLLLLMIPGRQEVFLSSFINEEMEAKRHLTAQGYIATVKLCSPYFPN